MIEPTSTDIKNFDSTECPGNSLRESDICNQCVNDVIEKNGLCKYCLELDEQISATNS